MPKNNNTAQETNITPICNKKYLNPNQIKFKAEPLKENHLKIIKAIESNNNTIISGCAGTGKTFVTLNLGLQAVAEKRFRSIHIFRSFVPVRNVGFLPGDSKEKMIDFEAPYMQIVRETFETENNTIYDWLTKDLNIINFNSTSFSQGITLHDSFIIVDEAQNLTYKEIYNVITRLGRNSVIHFCGDFKKQDVLDKKEVSGFKKMIDIIKSNENLNNKFKFIEMQTDDVVRDEIVKYFIIADFEYIDKDNNKR